MVGFFEFEEGAGASTVETGLVLEKNGFAVGEAYCGPTPLGWDLGTQEVIKVNVMMRKNKDCLILVACTVIDN